jgi:hypothetical protein
MTEKTYLKTKDEYLAPRGAWGDATTYTRIDESGKMWIGNEEYESQVNYCPMTGAKAPVQMKPTDTTWNYSDGTSKTFKEYINE